MSRVAQQGLPRPPQATPPEVTPEVYTVVDGFGAAVVGTVCVVYWRCQVTPALFQLQREALDHMMSRHAGRTCVLVVLDVAEPPSQEMREAMGNLLTVLAPRLHCVTHMIEGSGFRSAFVRGVLSGIELLRRNKAFPMRYFNDMGQAARSLSDDSKVPAEAIVQAVVDLRKRLDSLGRVRHSLSARSVF